MNKKVTFIIGNLRGGGAEKVCVTLANTLVKQGYQIDLVALNLNGAVRDKELSSAVNLIDLNVKHARYSIFSIWRYIRTNRPSQILSFNRQISVVLAILKKLTTSQFRLISRNIIFLSIAESNKKGLWHGVIAKFLIKKFYSSSDVIIAQSSAMKDDLLSYLGIPSEKVIVINNPVSESVSSYANKNSLNVNKDGYLLCVGRLEEQKAFHYALNGFSAIISEFPELRLKIVGQGSLEKSLKQYADELGIAERVDFEGFQEEMIPYYLSANLTVLTSLFEGFPNVLVESTALGTPVVAFDCPSGPSEIIIEGQNGYLVPYLDVDVLAEKLRLALSRQWDSTDVASTAERYSSETILKSYHALFNDQRPN